LNNTSKAQCGGKGQERFKTVGAGDREPLIEISRILFRMAFCTYRKKDLSKENGRWNDGWKAISEGSKKGISCGGSAVLAGAKGETN